MVPPTLLLLALVLFGVDGVVLDFFNGDLGFLVVPPTLLLLALVVFGVDGVVLDLCDGDCTN